MGVTRLCRSLLAVAASTDWAIFYLVVGVAHYFYGIYKINFNNNPPRNNNRKENYLNREYITPIMSSFLVPNKKMIVHKKMTSIKSFFQITK